MFGRYAVVVGINYTAFPADTPPAVVARATPRPLAGAEADAQAMASFLSARGDHVAGLFGAAATRQAIRDALEQQRRAAGPLGSLLVYFSGRGDSDTYYQDRAYLLPVDA